MPGPVSDSYDPEFGTAANAAAVHEAIEEVRDRITICIGDDELRDILEVVKEKPKHGRPYTLDERALRIIRYSLNVALECV